ncbi:MAG: hypothetical protein ACI4L5_00135 [Negativibacillus sp.]
MKKEANITVLKVAPGKAPELIQALFYDNLFERELSKKTGFHNMTIHNKKVRILKKLMEK